MAQATIHQPPEHRAAIWHGTEIGTVELVGPRQRTVTFGDTGKRNPFTQQLRLNRVAPKLLFEELRCQKSNQPIAYGSTTFAVNWRATTQPNPCCSLSY